MARVSNIAEPHEPVHPQQKLASGDASRARIAGQVWQTPDVLGVCAAQGLRTTIAAAGGAEGSARVSGPDATAHWVCNGRFQLVQKIGMQDVAVATLRCAIRLKCVEPRWRMPAAILQEPLKATMRKGPETKSR